ncbi:hypothetical protein [Metamycoplasma alkalescens]|uniref:hypothetical protein n=1 Tax=Metamycoplasma alkalescens TaxID=45363 RepID=UPI003D08DB7A
MNKLNGKNFWITYATFNIALLLIFSSIYFYDYSLLLGYFVGIISFLLFLCSLLIVLKMIKNAADNPQAKKLKKRQIGNFFVAILIFILFMFLNIGIFALFIWVNYYYHHTYDLSSKIAFFPFHVITMTSPYLLLSLFVIIRGIAMLFTNKKKGE